MKIFCEYCNSNMDDTDETCPHCGAVNKNVKRVGNGTPKTIAELRQWYVDHNLPSENVTRFFIGKDTKQAYAFGIYQDERTGNFIVYKNKDNGQRAVRYEGKDEAYAVNELYQKLKERIAEQKSRNASKRSGGNNGKRGMKNSIGSIVGLLGVFIICAIIVIGMAIPDRGYYSYNGSEYYYLDGWYIYDDGWHSTDVDSDLNKHYSDYYAGEGYYGSLGNNSYYYTDFEDTGYYETWLEEKSYDSSSDDDWDSDSSWSSSDSWDSYSGDWGSDW